MPTDLQKLHNARNEAFRAYDAAAAHLHAICPDGEARTLAQLDAGNAFDRAREAFLLAERAWRDAIAVAASHCPSTW